MKPRLLLYASICAAALQFGVTVWADGRNASPSLSFEELLPEDTLFIAKVEEIGHFLTEFEEYPLLALWRDDDVHAFFAPLHSRLATAQIAEEFKAEFGIGLDRFQETFGGQAALAVTGLDFPESEGAAPVAEVVLLVDYGGEEETIERIMNRYLHESAARSPGAANQGFRVSPEEFLGATLHIGEIDNLAEQGEGEDTTAFSGGWAFVKDRNLLVLASPVETLREVVAGAVIVGDRESILDNPVFRKVTDQVNDPEFYAFVNLESLARILKEEIMREAANAAPNILGIRPRDIFRAFGLDVLEAVYVAINLVEGETSIFSGLFFREKRGLVKLLAYWNGVPPNPAFIPENAITASVSLFSLREFWAALEEIVAGISPSLPIIYESYLNQVNAQVGLDLRETIIETVDDKIVIFGVFEPSLSDESSDSLTELSQVYAVGIKDRQGFELAIKALEGMFGGGRPLFEAREYLEATIHTYRGVGMSMPETDPQSRFAYALTDRYLFLGVGSTGLIESAISRLQERERTLWDDAALADAMRRLPSPAAEVNYQDFGALLYTFFLSLAVLQRQLSIRDDALAFCDPAALPETKDFPYFLIAKTYSEDDILYARSLIVERHE